MIWGYHTTFDCKFGDKNKITNEDNIRSFVEALVFKIDMKSYGELQISHFAAHNPEVGGYSFCQMIETSNITGHFVDKSGNFYIDIFSCKNYDVDIAQKVIYEYFEPKEIRKTYTERGV
tara:strand:+ start:152 stop:508 length:357 start_codon:yes stop_codon:yes gene_type:complete